MNKKDLWLRLKAYHFDHLVPSHLWHRVAETFGGEDASTKAFAGKIARKLEWKHRFALRAIKEYKKFIYLGAVSDFVVTPSKVIDQVWHEHLLFTKAYRDFCSDVLGFEFDHHPELLPMTDQTGTFNAQYLDTLELYKKEFGINPPADIWSQPKFDKELVPVNGYESKKKTAMAGGDTGPYYSDTPLYTYFDFSDNGESIEAYPEFDGFGNGDGGGAGASDSWGSSDGDSGGDSGSSCSSSCGSSCGGGD